MKAKKGQYFQKERLVLKKNFVVPQGNSEENN